MRVARLARPNVRVIALTSSPSKLPALHSLGITGVHANLDHPRTLNRVSALGSRIIHLAPPPSLGLVDTRTTNLVRALLKRTPALHCVYASTTGVYGDCGGEWVQETRSINPCTERAMRRAHAEQAVRTLGLVLRGVAQVTTLRVPGIYAPDREHGTPKERLARGTPVLEHASDVFTNHIHADDLAAALWLALWRGANHRVMNVVDDTQMLMGQYMDWAADHYGLERPRRITRATAQQEFTPMQLSFLQESRRLDNQRLKKELKLRLRYPSVKEGLRDS